MTKEIKENVEPTLEYLKICVEDDTSFETTNCKALLDYITKLQKERDNLKTALDEGSDIVQEYKEENERLNGVINEIQWKPIDEYFKNKEKYDWVLVKYYDKYNFECIPSVAEYRCDNWYLKDDEKSLQDFEVRYFFDMQQLDKLTEIKGE